jgi:hypothetical protein
MKIELRSNGRIEIHLTAEDSLEQEFLSRFNAVAERNAAAIRLEGLAERTVLSVEKGSKT